MNSASRSHPPRLAAVAATASLILSLSPAVCRAAGPGNTATGTGTLAVNTGSYNTADGFDALSKNTSASYNTAVGSDAMLNDTTGYQNTAAGANALHNTTTGYENLADGVNALYFNTTGLQNTAVGADALEHNTTAGANTSTGYSSLYMNTTGFDNTAAGSQALFNNTSGFENTAEGMQALFSTTTGKLDTACGNSALGLNTTGNYNSAFGSFALYHAATGSYNVALGVDAGYNVDTGSNNIDIANPGGSGESGTIRIGTADSQSQTFIAGIYGSAVASGAAVSIDSDGHLGTVVSSRRFKENIQDMSASSDALYSLRPVRYRYKHEIDPQGIPQYGLVAEEVEKIDPALVVHDADGKPYSVRYDQVNAMLLNEFLKEHAEVQTCESKLHQQETAISRLEAAAVEQTKILAAMIQKVNAPAETGGSAPHLAAVSSH